MATVISQRDEDTVRGLGNVSGVAALPTRRCPHTHSLISLCQRRLGPLRRRSHAITAIVGKAESRSARGMSRMGMASGT